MCCVVCVTQEWSALGVDRHWFSTIDFQPPPLSDLVEGVRLVESVRERQQSVYVHCKAGKGRSTTMVACYLMKVSRDLLEKWYFSAKSKFLSL